MSLLSKRVGRRRRRRRRRIYSYPRQSIVMIVCAVYCHF
jgi:hypothetical protein